jgi:undecaprenyl diphosphate synthase
MTFILALSYSGRSEIVQATKAMIRDIQHNKLELNEITEATFSEYLYTKGLPDPDLFIRTSGEVRVSNFLLWQIAYSEMYITKALWPDFTIEELHKAIEAYGKRDRRFGLVKEDNNQA